MNKILVSISLKTLIKIFEILLISNIIFNCFFSFDISLVAMIVMLLSMVLIDNVFLSTILFNNKIVIVNKFKIIKYDYVEIEKVVITFKKNFGYVIGKDIDLTLILKNRNKVKCFVGPIYNKKKSIDDLNKITQAKNVKFQKQEE